MLCFHPDPVGEGEGVVAESIRRIEKLLNTTIEFHQLDLLDRPGLENLFKKVKIFIHLIILESNRLLSDNIYK